MVAIDVHGVRLALESDSEGFLAYARQHLARLLSSSTEAPDIRAFLYWNRALVPQGMGVDGCQRWGRRLFLGDNKVIQTEILNLPGLQLQTSLAGAHVVVEAAFRPPSKGVRWLSRLGGESRREGVYAALIYYLVYFPLLWYFGRTRQWYPLHASAVAWPHGAIMLSGLGGIGKSTLTLAFLGDPQARLLSENLVLYDQNRVYAFPEPIHLDDRSRKMLVGLDGRLEPTGRMFSHQRQSYEIPASARTESAVPRLFCILRQGKALDLSPMPAHEALGLVMSSETLAREVNEYAQQAATLNLLSPITDGLQQRVDTLRQVLKQASCYVLTLQPGENLSRAVNLVREGLERPRS